MKNCILFRTYSFQGQAVENFKQYAGCGKPLFILYDSSNKELLNYVNAFNFNVADYEKLPYLKASPEIINMIPKPPKTSQVIYCNPEYSVLMFWKAFPQFEYYYSFEWDLFKADGKLNEFFEEIDARDDDLLGIGFQSKGKEWYWDTFNFDVPDDKKRAMFGCFHRYSNKCLEVLDHEYSEGKYAWYETAVATLANINGLKISDLNWEYGTQWYAPETMCDIPLYDFWGRLLEGTYYRNMFFHPVRDGEQLIINN